MALDQEMFVEKGATPVLPVTADHTASQINKTEQDAMAERTVVMQEQSSMSAAAGAKDPNNEQGALAADAILEGMFGAKSILSAVQMVSERMTDNAQNPQAPMAQSAAPAKNGDSFLGGMLNTVQETVAGATQQAGLQAHPVTAKIFGPANVKSIDGGDLLARTEIAASSLRKPEPVGITGDKNDRTVEGADMKGTKVPNVAQTRSFTMKKQLELEQVMDSVHAARLSHNSMRSRAMDLGFDLGSGPRPPRQQLNQIEEQTQWWKQNMEEAGKA